MMLLLPGSAERHWPKVRDHQAALAKRTYVFAAERFARLAVKLARRMGPGPSKAAAHKAIIAVNQSSKTIAAC